MNNAFTLDKQNVYLTMRKEPSFLTQVMSQLYEILIKTGIDPETAREVVIKTKRAVQRKYGGRVVYIEAPSKEERNARIIAEYERLGPQETPQPITK